MPAKTDKNRAALEELFPPTADGFKRWMESTRPQPSHADALVYARTTLPEAEQAKLRKNGYPEL